jgi:hypothetical protein
MAANDGRGVTSYTYNADGSVTHKRSSGRLNAPLSKEEAGDEPCKCPILSI